jgi:hypothetical protein
MRTEDCSHNSLAVSKGANARINRVECDDCEYVFFVDNAIVRKLIHLDGMEPTEAGAVLEHRVHLNGKDHVHVN